MKKIGVAIIGPGNIGSDLMFKVFRSRNLEMKLMTGIVQSAGIERANQLGIATTTKGIDELLARKDELGIQIVFDATGAAPHLKHAPLLKEAGLYTIDMTPAAVGPYLVPSVNPQRLEEGAMNVNMVTCGGQATIPIVHAVARVAGAKYAEIVSAISSKSAGPGTRSNIDEFTETTAKALEEVGGADRGKAIIILNPAEPPIMMTNTIYVKIKDTSVGLDAITESVMDIVKEMQQYVPGYQVRVPPMLDGDRVTVGIQVEGAGDFLPVYSGNLDIINAAAIQAAEKIAEAILEGRR